MIGALAAGCLCAVTLPTGNRILAYPSIMCYGIFIIPCATIEYTYAIELSYPVCEAMSNGTMIFINSLTSTVISIFVTELIQMDLPMYVIMLFQAMFCLGLFALSMTKEELRRPDSQLSLK